MPTASPCEPSCDASSVVACANCAGMTTEVSFRQKRTFTGADPSGSSQSGVVMCRTGWTAYGMDGAFADIVCFPTSFVIAASVAGCFRRTPEESPGHR